MKFTTKNNIAHNRLREYDTIQQSKKVETVEIDASKEVTMAASIDAVDSLKKVN